MNPPTAAFWDRLVADSRENIALPGANARVRYSADGQKIAFDLRGEVDHPWMVSTSCAPISRNQYGWRASVKPGFVNGTDVMIGGVPLTAESPSSLVLNFRDPLRGGIDDAASADSQAVVFAPGEGYPDFFKTLGVKLPSVGGANEDAGDAVADGDNVRELRACDIALVVPRIATAQTASIETNGFGAQSIAISTTFQNVAFANSPPHLTALSKWIPPAQPSALDQLAGNAVDAQTDEILIATVYMVSPGAAYAADIPDAQWTPYTRYNVFWNLCHAAQNLPPQTPPDPIVLQTGLPLADFFGNLMLGPVNDANAQVLAYLNSTQYSGAFWSI